MAKFFKYKVNDRVKTVNGQWGTITKLETKGTFPYQVTWDSNGTTERYKEKNFDDWKWKVHSSADEEVEPNQAALDFSRGCYEWKVGDRVLPKINPDYPADEQWQPGELIVRNADDQENIEVFNPQFPEEYSIIAGRFLEPCLPNLPNLPIVITAQASAQVMPLQDCSLDSSLLVYASATNGVKASSNLDIQELISPQISTNWTAHKSQSKSLQARPRANRSRSKAKDKEQQMSETASPDLFELSKKTNQAFSPSRTSKESLAVPTSQETEKAPTSYGLNVSFSSWASDLSGELSPADTLKAPSLEKDSCWLDSPAGLSSDASRPPGQDKLTSNLKANGHLQNGECINPIFLEGALGIPEEWSNPLECRTAAQLLADVGKPSETALTPESPLLPSEESSISTASSFSNSGLAISFGKTYPELLKGKSVTRRTWKNSHAQKFIRAYQNKLRVQALDKDQRYGGKQVGWLTLLEEPHQEALSDMPDSDLAAEGFPHLSKAEFINQFFEGKPETVAWVVRFKFEPLEVERSPDNPPDPLEKFEFYATVPAGVERPELMPSNLSYLFVASSFWNRSRAKVKAFPRIPKFPAGARTAADGGGYMAATQWGGRYPYTPAQFVQWLSGWNPEWAATFDYPCEPPLTGGNRAKIRHRQKQTTKLAWHFWNKYRSCPWQWIPTIQGWDTEDYIYHAQQLKPLLEEMQQHYGESFRVGIGTLCTRASNAQIKEIVEAVSSVLPGFTFHLWGMKQDAAPVIKAFPQCISSDSAAWDGLAGSRDRKIWEEEYRGKMSQAEYSWTVALPKYLKSFEKKLGASISGDRPNPLEKLEPSTDRESQQCGSLYQYAPPRTSKVTGIRTFYPIVEGRDRNPANDDDWYWGISYEGKSNGKRESKSKPISRSMLSVARELIAAKCPVEVTLSLCQLKPIWMERKGEDNWLVGETKPSKCPRFFVFSFQERELFITGPTWGESFPAYRHRKRKELAEAISSGKPFAVIKEILSDGQRPN